MHQILYVSIETHPNTREELRALLKQSREKNARLGLTGILIYYKKHFFQVLEGEKDAVFALYRTIREDKRHSSVILVWDQPIEKRSFHEWSMAFLDLDKIDKSQLESYSDFLEKGFTSEITDKHLTIAEELLLKFKSFLE